MSDATAHIDRVLADIQRELRERALAERERRTTTATTREEFVAALKRQTGFVLAPWCDRTECELAIKTETSAVSRVIVADAESGETCAYDGSPAKVRAYFARSY